MNKKIPLLDKKFLEKNWESFETAQEIALEVAEDLERMDNDELQV